MGLPAAHLVRVVIHPYLDSPGPIAFAHRGGALEAPENSLAAFRHAANLGFTHIETDVRATADGVPVVFHDPSLDRITDRAGRIRDLTLAQVRGARIAGAEPILTLAELLEEFPGLRFNIDIKEDNAVRPVLDLLSNGRDLPRLCLASFSWARLREVRRTFGSRVCTALAPQEVAALLSHSRWGRMRVAADRVLPTGALCVQVPPRTRRVRLVTAGFVTAAHGRGWPVHVWTIDESAQMHDLLDMGVDGIMTDRPTVLRQVLASRQDTAM